MAIQIHDMAERLCVSVVKAHFPEDVESVPALVEIYLDENEIDELPGTRNTRPQVGFEVDARGVSDAVQVVAATVAFVEMIFRARQVKRDHEMESRLAQQWKAMLLRRGVSPDLADRIPVMHRPEFLSLLDGEGATIEPRSAQFCASGGEGAIAVTAGSAVFAWTAIADVAWMKITSHSHGSGSGHIMYSVSANDSPRARAGTLMVAGHSFSVNQSGGTAQ